MPVWHTQSRVRALPDQVLDTLPSRQLAGLVPDLRPRRRTPHLPAATPAGLSIPKIARIARLLGPGRRPRTQPRAIRETVERLEAAREVAERLGDQVIPGRRRRRAPVRQTIAYGLLGGAAAIYTARTLRSPAPRFHFITDWFIPAPPEEVWKLLSDPRTYPEWWSAVWLDVQAEESSAGPRVGARYHYYTRGKLPYTLRWDAVTTEVDPPRAIAVRASGDFVGRARWTIQAALGGSRAQLDWELIAEHPAIRLLNPIARPLLEWNHRWSMAQGEAGIRSRLTIAH